MLETAGYPTPLLLEPRPDPRRGAPDGYPNGNDSTGPLNIVHEARRGADGAADGEKHCNVGGRLLTIT